MPKRIPEAELAAIVAVASRVPAGGSVSCIAQALGGATSKRTLQRRLALLVKQGRLVQEGQGPGARYRTPAAQVQSTPAAVVVEDQIHVDDQLRHVIPLSAAGDDVAQLVRAPIQQRQPVGYQRAFLENYIPGSTWHLSQETRDRLRELGSSPDQGGLAGTFARKVYERLLIDLSWNSSRLEGNTYSLLETERLLELGESAAGADALETQMILNHKEAIAFLVDEAEHTGFNRHTILNLHALLAKDLLPDSAAWGSLRSAGVRVAGSCYHPLEVPQLIDECFRRVLDKAADIPDPVEQAFFALVHLSYLQPFLDVNKRVSRLAANLPLIRNNLCPLSFVDVPTRTYVDGLLGVYELNRVELLRDVFSWAYERSCARYSVVRQVLGEPDPFRLAHRHLITQTIRAVVLARMGKAAAAAYIRRQAPSGLTTERQGKFTEIVETDLLNLHEGSIATARLTKRQFDAWQAQWR